MVVLVKRAGTHNLTGHNSSYRVRGFTLLEILVVVAILGVLMTMAAVGLRPPAAKLAARDYQALIQNARHQAIRSNRPVVVALDAASGTVTVSVATVSNNVTCTGSLTVAETFELENYRGVSLTTDLSSSKMQWLPNGRPQGCGGALTASTTSFADARSQYDVHVSVAGQVELEAQ
jgi:prepilin-type N-terminal cleavage/methylation domain-containing protein